MKIPLCSFFGQPPLFGQRPLFGQPRQLARPVIAWLVASASLAVVGSVQAQDAALAADYDAQVRPLMAKYCAACHAGEKPEGRFDLAHYEHVGAVLRGRRMWQRVGERLANAEMPPEGEARPTSDELARCQAWLARAAAERDRLYPVRPGRVTMRRLNRAEYNNTIRDLLGIDFRPANDFPSDDVGYGFDNIGDVLSLPTLLIRTWPRRTPYRPSGASPLAWMRSPSPPCWAARCACRHRSSCARWPAR